MIPLCFDSPQQHTIWLEADRYFSTPTGGHSLICEDCTPTYADKMRDEGRCEHPEVVFQKRSGGLVGVITAREQFTSEYKGVCWHKGREKWVAQGFEGGVRTTIGYFATPLEAHTARTVWMEKRGKIE